MRDFQVIRDATRSWPAPPDDAGHFTNGVACGGPKQSGTGREIGRHGFAEFREVKSLVMRSGNSRTPWVKDTPPMRVRADQTKHMQHDENHFT